jgi:hypothetical protein
VDRLERADVPVLEGREVLGRAEAPPAWTRGWEGEEGVIDLHRNFIKRESVCELEITGDPCLLG